MSEYMAFDRFPAGFPVEKPEFEPGLKFPRTCRVGTDTVGDADPIPPLSHPGAAAAHSVVTDIFVYVSAVR